MEYNMFNKVQNIGAITLHDYEDKFIIEPKYKTTKISTKLVIDKYNQELSEIDFNQIVQSNENLLQSIKFSVLLGFIKIKNIDFLVVARDVMLIAIIEKHDIFCIQSVQFISLHLRKDSVGENKEREEIKQIIIGMKKILCQGHYFSYTFDLTWNQQQQWEGGGEKGEIIEGGQRERIRKDYIYNWHLQQKMRMKNVNRKWMVSVIQGFVQQFQIYLNGKKINYTLISRKTNKKQGTRFNARGLDEEGNVANYVETEQIITYMNHLFSFVTIRGSVPLFWIQNGITNQSIDIHKDPLLSKDSFNAHLYHMKADYQYIIIINLMNQKRNIEQMLNTQFVHMLQYYNDFQDHVKYYHFDFHQQCKNSNYESTNRLIDILKEQIDNFGFFGVNQQEEEMVVKQNGVLRVNCLDCLDRTNFIQTKICCYVLQQILDCLQCDLKYILKKDLIELIDQGESMHPLIRNLQKIWADNGDMISQHYAGTGSTMSEITRKGGKTDWSDIFQIGFKNIERFYVSKYEDQQRQIAIDLILGNQEQQQFYDQRYSQYQQ